MKNILVIEDEKEIVELLEVFLENAGYKVFSAEDGIAGIKTFRKEQVDLVLLDIMLPKLNGYDVCRAIRENSDVPIIMLTALSDEEHQIKGYDLKVDEYVAKPFSISILLKKIQAVLRRSDKCEKSTVKYKELIMNKEEYTVWVNGKEIFLTNREFDILYLFVSNPHRMITKEFLIDKVWGYEYPCDDQIIYTHVKNIRKKIGIDFIKTVRGVGYKLD